MVGCSLKVSMSGVMITLMCLLILVHTSFGLNPHHHHAHNSRVIQQVNSIGNFIGLIFPNEDNAVMFRNSGAFSPNMTIPYVDFYGRRFHIGTIDDILVIFIKAGERMLNVALTAQILLERFNVIGLVHFGTAGSLDDSLPLGSVSIPKFVAYTGAWNWKNTTASEPKLDFSTFNSPSEGDNLLGEVNYDMTEFFRTGEMSVSSLWLEMNSTWYTAVQSLQNTTLSQCINTTICLPDVPKLVIGKNASTSDFYVENIAYRGFLAEKFNVTTVDEESYAAVYVATAAQIPVVVFRGVSNYAGKSMPLSSAVAETMGIYNVMGVATKFIRMIGTPQSFAKNSS